jgi:glycosyltransferase involved in cell wall biosynthesis
MLRIGFDAKRLFNNDTGLGNYSRTLVRGLKENYPQHEYHLFSPRLRRTDETADFFSSGFTLIAPESIPGPLWRSFLMKRDIANASLDIYHGLSNELPYGIDTVSVCSIVTIHDLIFRFHPEDYPRIDRLIYEAKFRYACEKSHRIIAVSESTKRDIVSQYGVSEEKISVVYQTCDDRFRREIGEEEIETALSRYKLPPRYLLYVGTVNRRKNLFSIVLAMRQVKDTVPLPLVVIGGGRGYKLEVQKYVQDHGMQGCVLFAPHVDPTDLPAVYRRAAMVILPSRYEGFGLPIIEALMCRVPVITSRASSLPEVAGPGAWYCEVDKPESIAEGIIRIVRSPEYARQLGEEGYLHVQRFNRADISRNLMAVYESALAQAGRGGKSSA